MAHRIPRVAWKHLDTTHSPVVLWKFDGDLTDSSGNGYDLSVSAGTARYGEVAPGLRGCLFNGELQLSRVHTAALDLVGNMTIELIGQVSAGPAATSASQIPIQCGAAGESEATNYLYRIEYLGPSAGAAGIWQPRSYWEYGAGGTDVFSACSHYLGTGDPFHLVLVRSGSSPNVQLDWYVNGRLVQTTAGLTSPSVSGATQTIAVSPAGTLLNGGLASLKIIGSALTAAQVATEYRRVIGIGA